MRPSSTAGFGACRLAGALAAALLVAAAGDASAQYFRRNQVQYDRFDFKVLKTEHFDIDYYEEAEEAVQLAARLAERWYARLSQVLGHQLSSRQPLILHASHPHFRQTNAVGSEPGEGTGGVTESFKRRVVMPFAVGLAETDHVLGHEIVHALQFDMSTARGGRPMALALPLWFVEGMAEYLSLGPADAHAAMWMRDAVASDALPRIRQLGDWRYFPYRYGHAFWAYVAGRWGDEVVGRLLREAPRAGSLDELFEGILGVNEETLSAAWHESLRRAYAAVLETSQPAENFGHPLIKSTERGRLNLAPSLSPDGQRLVFLSERGLFSIDMFLADTTTGEVIRRLVRTATDPHFDSLQFLSSAGTWSPAGDRFLFSAIVRGRPVLTTIDRARRHVHDGQPVIAEREAVEVAREPVGAEHQAGPVRRPRRRQLGEQIVREAFDRADTRAHAMPVRPFTIAGRAMHYGRYGSDGEDPRLSPLFLGYPHLVRDYGVGSFRAGECGQPAGGGCPAFDQLLGSRMLVSNLELRFPLVGLVNRDQHYGWLPIEMALFADAGVAWTSGEAPSSADGPRQGVRSAGVEIDHVRPLDRPGRGWLWQFGFAPAF